MDTTFKKQSNVKVNGRNFTDQPNVKIYEDELQELQDKVRIIQPYYIMAYLQKITN